MAELQHEPSQSVPQCGKLKPVAATKATFAHFGVYYAAEMKAFFTSVLY
jgi:hypothetical protein